MYRLYMKVPVHNSECVHVVPGAPWLSFWTHDYNVKPLACVYSLLCATLASEWGIWYVCWLGQMYVETPGAMPADTLKKLLHRISPDDKFDDEGDE